MLLLLEFLVRDNPSIQGIVAFQGGLAVLLDILIDEGVSDGGEIVQVHAFSCSASCQSLLPQDCLRTLNALLCNNTSNQKYFLEMGMF
jgi:hypothetical protein